MDAARIGDRRWVVSPDMLEDNVQLSRGPLVAMLNGTRRAWADRVSGGLQMIAFPILGGYKPLTAENATAIRVGALCLAAEADKSGSTSIGDKYREIAAAITLVERRANGDAPTTETIMLAMA
jgi:hypothetical protein